MKIEKLTAGGAMIIGEVTLFPIIRTFIAGQNAGHRISGFASKRPVAIVVISPQGKRALNLSGEEVPLEQYAEIPEVKKLLAG